MLAIRGKAKRISKIVLTRKYFKLLPLLIIMTMNTFRLNEF